jgi:hypothetical protein
MYGATRSPVVNGKVVQVPSLVLESCLADRLSIALVLLAFYSIEFCSVKLSSLKRELIFLYSSYNFDFLIL